MKFFKYSAYMLVLSTAISFTACKKAGHGETKNITLNASVAAGTDYQLNLAPYGDADDVASITIPATNAAVSRIENAPTGFAPVYHFIGDAAKFTATDKVVITVEEGGRGRRCHQSDKTIITINFTIQ
jgi:hypothetical protein